MIRWKIKEVFIAPPQQLTNLQAGPPFKTRPIWTAKAKGISKSSEVMKIQNEQEKNGVRRLATVESKHPKIKNDSYDNWIWDFDMDKIINTCN